MGGRFRGRGRACVGPRLWRGGRWFGESRYRALRGRSGRGPPVLGGQIDLAREGAGGSGSRAREGVEWRDWEGGYRKHGISNTVGF